MAIIFMDGFDTYTGTGDLELNNWYARNGPSPSAFTPWGEGRSLRLNEDAFAYYFFPINVSPAFNGTQCTVGFSLYAEYPTEGGKDEFPFLTLGNFKWQNSFFDILVLDFHQNGSMVVQINDGGAEGLRDLATFPPGFFEYNTWSYWEVSFVMSDGAGKLRLDRDGERLLDLDSVDTLPLNLTDPEISYVRIYGHNPNLPNTPYNRYYDDFYVGDAFTDTLGPQRVVTLRPDGDVPMESDWIPSGSGGNYEQVNDIARDDDASYVTTDVVDAEDMYTVEDLPTDSKVVHAVQEKFWAKKTDTEVHSVLGILEIGATKVYGPEVYLASFYKAGGTNIYELNPDTGLPWTESDINSIKIGHKLEK